MNPDLSPLARQASTIDGQRPERLAEVHARIGVARTRRRLTALGAAAAAVTVVVAAAAWATGVTDREPVDPLGAPQVSLTPSETGAGTEWEFEPGPYGLTIEHGCGPQENPLCPPGAVPPRDIPVQVDVPPGWAPLEEGSNIIARDTASATRAPDGAALVIGWTSWFVGLNTDPCHSRAHEEPDLVPGLTVDDFVEAVRSQPALDVSRPVDTTLDGHPARWFRLRAPADIDRCDNWRPWDPGFFAQGPRNIWDVWVVDVDGTRVLVVAEYFPGTPRRAVVELDTMAESVRFGD